MELTLKQIEATSYLSYPDLKFMLYGGAIRGAKTWWLGIVAMELCKLYPNSVATIMRADGPKITNALAPSIAELYGKPEMKACIARHNQTNHTYTLKNGSRIKLMAEGYAADKELTRLHGYETNWFMLDELPEFQQITLDKCFERAGSWLNARPSVFGKLPRPMVLASANPTKNWVKEELYDKIIKGNGKPGYYFLQAKIYDNPRVPKYIIDNLRATLSPVAFERFVNGDWEWVESHGHEWLHEFDQDHHVRSVPYNPNLPTYLTFDFNVVPYMTMLCFQLEWKNDAWYVNFYDEFCLSHPKNTAASCVNEWKKKYAMRSAQTVPVYYCGDASGENRIPGFGEMSAFNEVRKALAGHLHNNSDKVYKKSFFNEFLRKFLNEILSGMKQIVIQIDRENCPKLSKDIQVTLEDKGGGFFKKIFKDSQTGLSWEENGHCVDAFKYGILSVFSQIYEQEYHRKLI